MPRHLDWPQVDDLSLARRSLVDLGRATSWQQTSIEKPIREDASLAGYVQVLMERRTSCPDFFLHIALQRPESEWTAPKARLPARLRGPSVQAPHDVHSASVQSRHMKLALPPILPQSGSSRLERRRSVASMGAPTSKNAPVSPARLSPAASPTTPSTRRGADAFAAASPESPRVAPWIGDLVRGAAGRARDGLVPSGLANVADLLLSLPASDQFMRPAHPPLQRQKAIRVLPPPPPRPSRARLVPGFQAPVLRTLPPANTSKSPARDSPTNKQKSPAGTQRRGAAHAGAVREVARLVASDSASPRRFLVIRKRSNSLCEKPPLAGGAKEAFGRRASIRGMERKPHTQNPETSSPTPKP
ncbi:hypothetical protein T484DRAFT_1954124 [Baffinella frigidus]|nr:hypothetical protein T484DRAFT_1954124 [Cryptophyta sp. CCMP2293]